MTAACLCFVLLHNSHTLLILPFAIFVSHYTSQIFPSHPPADTRRVETFRSLQVLLCTDTPALMAMTHETKGTDLGGQSGRGTDLTTGRSEVDDLFECRI